jgi:predicted nucleotidyltransferase
MTSEAVMAALIDVLERRSAALGGYRVFLYGSRATGTAWERSDFDVGVLGQAPMPVPLFWEIKDEFDAIPTLCKIDWVDFSKVSPTFRSRALEHIEVLYEG